MEISANLLLKNGVTKQINKDNNSDELGNKFPGSTAGACNNSLQGQQLFASFDELIYMGIDNINISGTAINNTDKAIDNTSESSLAVVVEDDEISNINSMNDNINSTVIPNHNNSGKYNENIYLVRDKRIPIEASYQPIARDLKDNDSLLASKDNENKYQIINATDASLKTPMNSNINNNANNNNGSNSVSQNQQNMDLGQQQKTAISQIIAGEDVDPSKTKVSITANNENNNLKLKNNSAFSSFQGSGKDKSGAGQSHIATVNMLHGKNGTFDGNSNNNGNGGNSNNNVNYQQAIKHNNNVEIFAGDGKYFNEYGNNNATQQGSNDETGFVTEDTRQKVATNLKDVLANNNNHTQQHSLTKEANVNNQSISRIEGQHYGKSSEDLQMARNVSTQISSSIDGVIKGKFNGKYSIKLLPQNLGEVNINISINKDGFVNASFIMDEAKTFEMLQRNSAQLQRSLEDAGYKMDKESLQFSMQQQYNPSDGGGKNDQRESNYHQWRKYNNALLGLQAMGDSEINSTEMNIGNDKNGGQYIYKINVSIKA